MNDCEFIQEREEDETGMVSSMLTGWESIVFQVEDVPPDDCAVGSAACTASLAPLNPIFE
jgi:hypothetical protein